METNNEWKDKVKTELIEVIDRFLEVAEAGAWGLKYINPVKESFEDGTKIYDKEKITGVDLFIQFNFENFLVPIKDEEVKL